MDPLDYINRSFVSESDLVANWERWHREHERRRASALGFLAITGLYWLNDTPQRFDDVPGVWSSAVDGVRVDLNGDEVLFVDDTPVTGHYHFENVDERGLSASFGDALVEVCRRDEYFMIRPRHPNHPVRTSYDGTPTYPASSVWVVTGTLVPHTELRTVGVGASVERLTHIYMSPGAIEFELAGEDLRLIAFNEEDSDELFIVFADRTSGDTSYAACRFLSVRAPGSDGRLTLDFNRATNPPCAYTDFATCPLPPAGNNLPVRIEAGERARTVRTNPALAAHALVATSRCVEFSACTPARSTHSAHRFHLPHSHWHSDN